MTDEERRLRNAFKRAYYRDHRDKLIQKSRKYRAENLDRERARGRKYYQTHREEILKKRQMKKESLND